MESLQNETVSSRRKGNGIKLKYFSQLHKYLFFMGTINNNKQQIVLNYFLNSRVLYDDLMPAKLPIN